VPTRMAFMRFEPGPGRAATASGRSLLSEMDARVRFPGHDARAEFIELAGKVNPADALPLAWRRRSAALNDTGLSVKGARIAVLGRRS